MLRPKHTLPHSFDRQINAFRGRDGRYSSFGGRQFHPQTNGVLGVEGLSVDVTDDEEVCMTRIGHGDLLVEEEY